MINTRGEIPKSKNNSYNENRKILLSPFIVQYLK